MKDSGANLSAPDVVVSAARLQRDEPSVVVTSTVGRTAVLPCQSSTHNSVYWSLKRENQRPTPIIENNTANNGFKGRFSLERGSHRLVILNTSKSDSGLYRCSEDGGLGPHHDVTLLVEG
jgi:Immunoglobulin V-set domain